MSVRLPAYVGWMASPWKTAKRVLPPSRTADKLRVIRPTHWRDVAKQMVHAWNEGMQTLCSPKVAPHFRGLDTAIAEAGFSGPRKPERSREVIGRSELLAKKH